MTTSGRSRTIELSLAKAKWFQMPGMVDEPHVSVTRANTLGLSFTAHPRTVIEKSSGCLDEVSVPPNACFVNGECDYSWVHVAEPYEGIEIELDPAVIVDVTREFRAPARLQLGDLMFVDDPVFWASAIRLREHATGQRPLQDIEGDTLVRTLLAHVVCEHFGGRPARRNMRPLDSRRLTRIAEYITAHLGEQISVSDLASVASMSPHHFHAAFRRATGLTPHAFVTARRVERARILLANGLSRAEAARHVGYTPGHGFRRVLKRYGSNSL